MATINKAQDKPTAWFVLNNELIYSNIHNIQFTTKMSTSIDALVKIGLNSDQIETYFQEIGINVYSVHIDLYKKYGITDKIETVVLEGM